MNVYFRRGADVLEHLCGLATMGYARALALARRQARLEHLHGGGLLDTLPNFTTLLAKLVRRREVSCF